MLCGRWRRRTCPSQRLSAGCSQRTWRARSTCPRSTAPRWTATPSWRGPGGGWRGGGGAARGAPGGGPGGIYSSKGGALPAQAVRAGAKVTTRETVPDHPADTRAALSRALDASDVVLVSGGVSVGPHDHVKPVLAELGVEERFWGVRLRPGKPTWFGIRGHALVFGLPGNPVSAMVGFHLFVRTALAAMQGADPSAPRTSATLDEPIARHRSREQAVRVHLETSGNGWRARATGPQGSHMLTSMLGATALARIAPGDGEVRAGERGGG